MKNLTTKPALNTNGFTQSANMNIYETEPVTKTLTNGFFTVDDKWVVKYWNKAAEKILGIKSKDIIGKNLWEKFEGIIPLEFFSIDQSAFLQDTPLHFEKYWGEMGAWFDVITYHCDDSLSVSFKSSKHPHAKINHKKRLKILTELYCFVTEITNDCLWEWNLEAGEIFWIDGGHKRMFGYPVENALIPQGFWESRIHPDDKERVMSRLKTILLEGSAKLWEDEYRFQKADGDFAHVKDRGHIIYDKNNLANRMIGATTDISEKVKLENKLTQERLIKQREITDAILTAQENERAVIGTELYENLNQVLAASKIYIGLAKKYEHKRDVYLEKSSAFIESVMKNIQKISKSLSIPGQIFGLKDSIQNSISDILNIHPMKIDFFCNDLDEKDLDEKLQINIFRIVQEQLNNVLSHAQATGIFISLSRNEDEIKLLISDNGIGCDLLKGGIGVGIKNIKSRADLYNGRVGILSNPGEGYDLRVVLLLPKAIPVIDIIKTESLLSIAK